MYAPLGLADVLLALFIATHKAGVSPQIRRKEDDGEARLCYSIAPAHAKNSHNSKK
jgi:hypothetical protein